MDGMHSETLAGMIVDLLAEEPMSGFALGRALATRHGITIPEGEGLLYAALVQLEGAGWIEGRFTEGEPGIRRRIYRLPVLVAAGEEVA
jgi:DNA-binding PadR family transcriptional regulator